LAPILIALLAIGINIPLMLMILGLLVFHSWHLGEQPYTSMLMFFGFIPLSFGIGLISVAIEVRRQEKREKTGNK
jgi:hypothetical protein